MSVAERVRQKVSKLPGAEPFNIRVFDSLGGASAIQSALRRMVLKGELDNSNKGYYSKSKSIKALPSMKVFASAENTALLWVKENGYTITCSSFEAAYRMGFQKQQAVKRLYWTSGPTRTFRVGNETTDLLHKGPSKLLLPNTPEGDLMRASLEVRPEYIKDKHLLNINHKLIEYRKPYDIIKEAMKLPISKAWRSRFKAFLETLKSLK